MKSLGFSAFTVIESWGCSHQMFCNNCVTEKVLTELFFNFLKFFPVATIFTDIENLWENTQAAQTKPCGFYRTAKASTFSHIEEI